MNTILGVINLINDKSFLKELTNHRCLASVPYAGRYRLIDFTLSNYIHAGISNVAVFTKTNYRSTINHLRSGKEWELDRHNGGLFILPSVNPDKKLNGDLQHFHDHIDLFKRTQAEFVVISPGYHIGKIDYHHVVNQHLATKADITVVYKNYEGEPVQKPLYHKCSIDKNNNVSDIELYSSVVEGDPICLETYMIRKELLVDLIESCIQNEEYDFLRDVVKAQLTNLSVKAYRFSNYMPFIHSLESYYSSQMALLHPELIHACFYDQWEIYTKTGNDEPTKYAAHSQVANSLVANGCHIEGTVENSIIFQGAKIKKGAVVRNSIIMHHGEIGENVHLDNVITDKRVRVTNNKVLIGKDSPVVIEKSAIV